MKTVEQIEEEITFQLDEIERIKRMLDLVKADSSKRSGYANVMSKHAARAQALKWAISSD